MHRYFMDLRRVRYVVAIAEHGSISGAARALGIAQPALSYHLSETETTIGAPLFDRLPTGMVPNVLGLVFVEHGRLLMDTAAVAEDDIRRLVRGVKDHRETIRLAIIPSLASVMAPALIDAFAAHLPDHVLHVIDARTSYAEELLDQGKADIAIRLVSADEAPADVLAWERLCCVTRIEAGTGPISFADAASSGLILPAHGNPLRAFLEAEASKLGLELNIKTEIDGFEPRLRVVMSGHGTTVIGMRSIGEQNLGPDLTARPIVAPELMRPIVCKSRVGLNAGLLRTIRKVLHGVFESDDRRQA